MKNIQTTLFVSFLLLLNCLTSKAQQKYKITFIDDDPTPIYYKWLGTDSKILTHLKITYKKPDGFKEVITTECFKDYPKLELTFSCLGNQLCAKDKQFVAFMPIFRTPTKEDSISMQKIKIQLPPTDMRHIFQLKGVIRDYMGEEAAENWKKIVTYYPDEIAKNTFNADTVIRFTMPLRPEDYYKKKFKYVDALFIQKNGRGYVNFYCFYTDKAKKKLDYYWKKIEGVLRFED